MSLRLRLAALVAATVALAIAGATVGALVTARAQLRATTDAFLLDRAQAIVTSTEAAPGPRRDSPTLRGGPRVRFPDGGQVFAELDAVTQMITAGGRIRTFGGPATLPVDERDRALAAGGGSPLLRDVALDGVPYRIATVPFPAGGALQVARSQVEEEAILDGLRGRMTGVGVVGSALAAVLAALLARRFTRPIEALTGAAERVAYTEDLTEPIPVEGDDEVARLAASFNTMLAALRVSREQQHRLVMDASHELRTPLTSLRTNLELLERAPDLPPADRKALLADVRAELVALSDLVTELVDLATAPGAGDEPVQMLSLPDLVADVVRRDRRRYRRPIELTVADDAARPVEGRPGRLARAVHNLVDNAAKFAPERTPIEVVVGAGSVTVRDFGPGITVADLPRVFDRFYRGASARSLPGSGLGLAIVKDVVEAHGGTVHLGPAPGGGTVAGFRLPVAPAGPVGVSARLRRAQRDTR